MAARGLLTGLVLCAGIAAPASAQEAPVGTWFHECRADEWTGRQICKASFNIGRPGEPSTTNLHVVMLRKDQPVVVVGVSNFPPLTVAGLRVEGMPPWFTEQCSGNSCTFTGASDLVDMMAQGTSVLVRFTPRGGSMQDLSVPLAGFSSAWDAAKRAMNQE